MSDVFLAPWWLWAALPLSGLLWAWRQRLAAGLAGRRGRWRLALRGGAYAALVLALAGLQLPGRGQAVQVVATVDLSDSIYDRQVQEDAVRRLEARLAGRADVACGTVVFGKHAGIERPVEPLPPPAAKRERREADPEPAAGFHALANLVHPMTAVDASATDIGGGLDAARGLLSANGAARAIVLVGDGHDTAGRALAAAAALSGSGIDLLALPSELPAGADVHVASLRLPQTARAGRGVPIEVAVAGQRAGEVRVQLSRRMGGEARYLGAQTVKLVSAAAGGEARAVTRFIDRPDAPGVAVYDVALQGPDGGQLLNNYVENDRLEGALRIAGPAKWGVLARAGGTLEAWAAAEAKDNPLKTELTLFRAGAWPRSEADYAGLAGVLVDGLDAQELSEDGEGLKALAQAVRDGLGLIAFGGEKAFGAGGHPEGGAWERLLPVTFRPEDDRVRTLLFAIDASKSMEQAMQGGQQQKLFFAKAQIVRALQVRRPTDRLGLIAFAEAADTAFPVTPPPNREGFQEAMSAVAFGNQTNILGALGLARELLAKDNAEEQVVVLLSDGQQTPVAPEASLLEAARALCPPPAEAGKPRRTRLHCFGIEDAPGAQPSPGEQLLRKLAQEGGGQFFPDFAELARSLKTVVEERGKDLYARREPFAIRLAQPQHPVLAGLAGAWPRGAFRNRVKARETASVLLKSEPAASEAERGARKSDPLLVLGHAGLARTAALAFAADGAAGESWLKSGEGWPGGAALVARAMAWVEHAREDGEGGWRVQAEEDGEGALAFGVDAAKDGAPLNELALSARIEGEGQGKGDAFLKDLPLLPVAPGRYEGRLEAPQQGVYRVEIQAERVTVAERFVTVPYAPEYRRFGTDRLALEALVQKAGGRSRMLNVPGDLDDWLDGVEAQRTHQSARPWLLALAGALFLCEIAARGMKARA